MFGFPRVINEKAARTVAGVVAMTGVVALATGAHWLLIPLAYGFWARVLTGPRFSPLAQLATKVVAPRLGTPKYVPGPPKRFAQGIGAALTTIGAVVGVGLVSDAVADAVLAEHSGTTMALANAIRLNRRLLPVHSRLMKHLEKTVGLDREIEGLPSDKQLKERAAAGSGLTEPELSVLLSYVKIWAKRAVLDSDLPAEEWTAPVLREYFPAPLRERYADLMAEHPLHREIVTTAVVGEAVNRGGTTFFFRIADETGADVVDVIRAYVIIRDAFGLPDDAPIMRAPEDRIEIW